MKTKKILLFEGRLNPTSHRNWLTIRNGRTIFKKKFASIFLLFVILICLSQQGCKKFVEVNAPNTSLSQGNVYANNASAIAAVTSIYSNLSVANIANGSGELSNLSFNGGLLADELTLWSGISDGGQIGYYTNSLNNGSGFNFGGLPYYWTTGYKDIFMINSAIEGLIGASTLTPAVKQELLGEAKFNRALYYFYLVNLYGDVPLILTSDYKVNSQFARTPSALVYQQIITDLKDAQNSLSSGYLDGSLLKTSNERVRPIKWAAAALLARVYLYQKDWANAAIQASLVISSPLYSLNPLNQVFMKNNSEAIFQLQPVFAAYDTQDAQTFVLPATGPSSPYYPVYLSQNLLNSFETGDQRKTAWINSVTAGGTTYFYPYKYKNYIQNSGVTEYSTVLRLAEQYLIRAEAEANGANGGVSQAIIDLNAIRTRAGLPNYAGPTDVASLTAAILHERQVELFSEWGHRWLDLKRTSTIDPVMTIVSAQKGGSWSSYKQWFPLPISEILTDPKLTQNQGY